MCGFAGFIEFSRTTSDDELAPLATRMAARLESRGPDDSGAWADPGAGIALGHRRLSIIDLSPNGRQPMISASGRLVIAYNGEVYNFPDLRAELEGAGHVFTGDSDTEVILEACDAWGVEATAERLIGMYALALWDRKGRTLTLLRDRLGIKPLYWGRQGGVLFFGSQPKAFEPHPAWRPEVDRAALSAYMRHSYVPAPRSIYRDVHKLEPGHMVVIGPDGEAQKTCYWDLRAIARAGVRGQTPMSDREAADALHDILFDAVGRRMVADVPLGAFLSGGVDSSTVVALMQAQSPRPVRTFSIGFREGAYDEAPYAKAVAAHLGTEHTELYAEPRHALEVIPRIPEWYDEPFADSSQIPTYLVSKLTRDHVTVALSGDGGDEVFAGYNRYFWGTTLQRCLGRVPGSARRALAAAMRSLSPRAWDALLGPVPHRLLPPQAGDKIHKLAEIVPLEGPDALYRGLVSQWADPDGVVAGGREPWSILWDETLRADIPGFIERMQFLDEVTYLPDDILAKVDRASMAVGLEARVPLLDHRVVEFSWRLPPRLKVRGRQGKWLLRQVLDRHVPRDLIERPKMGFGVPIHSWLRNELRDWAEDLLDETRLRREGYFNPKPVRDAWSAHLSGHVNQQYRIWPVLMFQAWLQSRTGRLSRGADAA